MGERQLQIASMGTSNEKGDYSLEHLETGTYYVMATPREVPSEHDGLRTKAVATFYPNARSLTEATPVKLSLQASNSNGIDIKVATEDVFSISGHVVNGHSGIKVTVVLTAQESSQVSMIESNISSSGDFVVEDIPAGAYTLHAIDKDGHTRASQEVEVIHASINDIVLDQQSAFSVRGEINYAGTKGDDMLAHVRIGLLPASTSIDSHAIFGGVTHSGSSRGTFAIGDVPPGIYRVKVLGVPAGEIARLQLAGRQTSDNLINLGSGSVDGLEIKISEDLGSVEGRLKEILTSPTTIVMWPKNVGRAPGADDVRRTQLIGQSDTFLIGDIPTGPYYMIAVASRAADLNTWLDPDFLTFMESKAESVDVVKGSNHTALSTAPISEEEVQRELDALAINRY